MSGQTEQTVTLQQEHQVTIPIEERMMINLGDWERLKKSIERLGDPLIDQAKMWSATSVGVGITVAASIVSIEATNSTPKPGLMAGLWVALVAAILFAICFGLVGRRERKRQSVSSSHICADMDDISKRAGHSAIVPSTQHTTSTPLHSEELVPS